MGVGGGDACLIAVIAGIVVVTVTTATAFRRCFSEEMGAVSPLPGQHCFVFGFGLNCVRDGILRKGQESRVKELDLGQSSHADLDLF